jgi:PAS domain S-box-containing protein
MPWWGLDQRAMTGFINRQTKSLFGYDRNDLVGPPMETLVPEPRWQVDASRRADYFAGRRTRSVGPDLELSGRYRHRAGSPAKISLSHIDAGDVVWDHGGG